MGGKGIRRREKNYKAAHDGGHTSRLPPPPDPSAIDALPSKLRKLFSFAGKQQFSHGKNSADQGVRSGDGIDSTTTGMKRKRNDQTLMAQDKKHGGEDPEISKDEKKKKKKVNSKKVADLRFEALDKAGAGSRRKERKKQLLEARKKKHKKPRTEEDMEFPGCEEIKFGEVVQAPPKLTNLPKVFKEAQVASQERLRLQAVDAYRKRKGWESRPGVKLPTPVTTSLFP